MSRKLTFTLAVLVVMGGLLSKTAHGENLKVKCNTTVKAISFYKQATWKWQDEFGLNRSKVSKAKIASCKYGKWVAKVWQTRAWKWRDTYTSYEKANRDFHRASLIAHAIFRDISPNRLWYRASVEGGHGSWYCNHSGSGACGWFQFMSGTYYGRSGEAFAEAAKRGYPIPRKFNSWYSVLGQNITAAYMFSIGLECKGEGWAASC